MTTIGIISREQAVQIATETPVGRAVGLIGTDEDMTVGHVRLAVNTPQVVRSVAEAELYFGTVGSLRRQAILALAQSPPPLVIGARFDETLTGSALIAGLNAAMNALLNAEQVTTYRPTVLCAQDLTYDEVSDVPQVTANSLVTTMQTVAETLGAIGVADGAYDTVAKMNTWETNNQHDRILNNYNRGRGPSATADHGLSPAIAGFMASQPENVSPLNAILEGVSGITPRLTYDGRAASDLQTLLAAGSGAVIHLNSSYRYWTPGLVAATDPFDDVVIRRVSDRIEREAENLLLEYVGSGLEPSYVETVQLSLQNYLDRQAVNGLVVDATARPDTAYNIPANTNAGKIGFILDLVIAGTNEIIRVTRQIRRPTL